MKLFRTYKYSAHKQILISLNYEQMTECNLVYQGKALTDKSKFLRDVLDRDRLNEVTVTPKGQLEAVAQQVNSIVEIFTQYPIYSVGGIVAVILFVLFLLGE